MILDSLCELASALAVDDTDAYTTYSIDLGNVTPKRDLGAGEPMAMIFCVDVAASGSTDTTDFKVVQATSADLATGTVALVTRRIAKAKLTAGSIHVLPIPPDPLPLRYLGGRVELGSSDGITVSVYVLPLSFVQKYVSYADAVTFDA